MKKSEFETLHPHQKLDVLFDELVKIRSEVHTPFWQKALSWFTNNFFTLVVLFLLIWGGRQVLNVVSGVQKSVDRVSNQYEAVQDSVTKSVGGFDISNLIKRFNK